MRTRAPASFSRAGSAFRCVVMTSASALRRSSRTGTGRTGRPLACSMIWVRGPSLITVLFTTLMFVMLTVLLMMVVLLTTTVVGRTGSRNLRSSTKTMDRGAMGAASTATEPLTETLTDGCKGAQPT